MPNPCTTPADGLDVVRAAWAAAGSPTPARLTAAPAECARCGRVEPVTTTRVVSDTFTAFTGWVRPAYTGVCASCAWAHTTPRLRVVPLRVDRTGPSLRELTHRDLGDILTPGALRPDMAVTIPTRPGRKHLLPEARWGMVVIHDALLPWTSADARRLTVALHLTAEHAAPPRALAQPAPPYPWLATRPPETWQDLQHLWSLLNPWRTDPSPWLAAVQFISRRDTQPA